MSLRGYGVSIGGVRSLRGKSASMLFKRRASILVDWFSVVWVEVTKKIVQANCWNILYYRLIPTFSTRNWLVYHLSSDQNPGLLLHI